MIPASSMMNIKSCNVWYNSSKGILRLWLQKTSKQKKASLVGMVLDEQGVLVLPGYITEADDHVAYPFHICPSLDKSSNRNYSIFLSATPLTGINLTVQVDESIMTEKEDKSLEFGHKITSRLLVFDVSSIQGKFDHFQVTVRSEDDTRECLLFVSNNCDDVVNVDAIDPQAVNFKESSGTLHLTFTTFGRITLSHASKPQLTTGRWYIGIFLKNANGKNHKEFTKTVKVSVGFAGGINRVSFTQPILLLVLLSFLGGSIIALFADFFLNPEFEHQLVHKLRMYVNSHIFRMEEGADANDNAQNRNEASPPTLKVNGHNSLPTGSICLDLGQDSQQPYDIVKLSIPKHWPGLKNWGNVMLDWFRGDERSYAFTTGIVAISLLTGAIQFIVSNWRDMIESGNRDICYYNEGCYRATPLVDVPYNLIISNLTYVIHGFVIALSVSLREATCRVNERMLNVTVRKDSFSIMYAFAWSLVFQGIFSACYHMCPSRMTFQFDSAFMFVICGLVIVAAFNSLVSKSQHRQSIDDESPATYTSPVFETKLYLFFVMPLLVLNYIGSIRDTEGLLMFNDAVFYFMCILWITCMFAWVFFRLMLPWKPRPEPAFWCKFSWLCALFPVIMLFIGLYTVDLQKNWSIFFLFTCLAAVMCTVIGYSLTACSQNIFKHVKKRKDLTAHESRAMKWKMYLKWPIVNFHVILYAVCTVACWLIALYYFLQKPVTDKVKSASKSRELNAECSLWEFFDDHDLWHIASSFALMLTAYLIIWCIG
ncbi:uncharacterized protein LOC114522181 [Dendronephthya gigantea]|uniref:uncharacterized protein LOC114522181 n=1 Tax=Dendronephthya gigantea TaxID=151771 RepID=UPI0010696A77|nr:uncharacterized protein LOC114522181 [Dendronephthya gigantea]